MAKRSGLGDNAYVSTFDLSGDVLLLTAARGGPAALDFTPINSFGYQRLGGERDGELSFVTAMDPAAGASHAALSPLPTADVQASYFVGQAVGNPAFSIVSKQVNYDPNRPQDGSLPFSVQCLSNAFGAEWGLQLTPGIRSETAPTNTGTSIDNGASTAFGAQAYFHVFSLTGTNADIRIQDSPDNSVFTLVTGLEFNAFAIGTSRVATANNATINRYVRVAVPFGSFTQVSFAVSFMRNPIAGQVF